MDLNAVHSGVGAMKNLKHSKSIIAFVFLAALAALTSAVSAVQPPPPPTPQTPAAAEIPLSPLLDPNSKICISANRESTVPGIAYYRADILCLDEEGTWSTLFDASDLGVPTTTDLHGFTFLDDGSILMVFDVDTTLPGLDQPATPWDVVRFIPETLGDNTDGTFASCPLDGSGQLTADGEKIDALHAHDNALYLSVEGAYSINQGSTTLTGNDEDILKFTPDGTLCGGTGGTWSIMLENAVAQISGLASEDVISLWLDADLQPHISMLNDFTVLGISGNQQDVLQLERNSSGSYTGASIYWHGPFDDFFAMIDGLHIGYIPLLTPPAITGIVTAEDTGLPLEGINVELYQQEYGYWHHLTGMTTSPFGSFLFPQLSPGNYRLQFNDYSDKYFEEYYDNAPDFDSATTIIVTEDQVIQITAELAKKGSIFGTVTAEDTGIGLEGIDISVYQWVIGEWNYLGSYHTNPDGSYEINGLETGIYRVRFSDGNDTYVSEYYDNAVDLESATDIHVSAGSATQVDAQLAIGGTITGTITAEDTGFGLEGINISVYQWGDGEWNRLLNYYANTNPDGSYEINGLVTGTYGVRFRDYNDIYAPEYYDDALDLTSATDIAVTTGQITAHIDAQLAIGGTISGHITDEDSGDDLEGISASAYRWADREWSLISESISNPDGTFAITGLNSGNYRVHFSDYSYFNHLDEYYNDAEDVESAADIPVTVGAETSNINAALAKWLPPPNDNFDDAIIVSALPFTHEVNTLKAGTEPGEPELPCYDDYWQVHGTVWYAYTPAEDGSLNADTFGSDYDTVLAIWEGQWGSLNLIDCNDNANEYGPSEILNAPLSAGVTYYIEVYDIEHWYAFGSLVLHLISSDNYVQDIDLDSGWNLVSSCVNLADPDLAAVFAGVMDDLVLVKNGDGEIYWPAFGINQIGTWDVRAGYQVYMTTDRVLSMTGRAADSFDTPIDLNSGWNMVSYLSHSSQYIEDALYDIRDTLYLVKNGAGQVYWPDMDIYQFDYMVLGEGYQIYMNAPDTLIYP